MRNLTIVNEDITAEQAVSFERDAVQFAQLTITWPHPFSDAVGTEITLSYSLPSYWAPTPSPRCLRFQEGRED